METKISKTDEQNLNNIFIEKNVYKGYGLAHKNGQTIFVSKVIAKDVVDVKINYKKSGVLFATPIKFLSLSEYRNNLFCNVFQKCGGCDWLIMKYKYQLETKKQIISELFRTKKLSIIPSEKIHYYRNKTFMPIAIQNKLPVIGMFQRNSHKVIEHKKCFLTPPIFNEIIKIFKEYLIKTKAKIYDEKNHTGNFRFIGFRINKKNKIIIIIVTKNSKMPFTKLLVKKINEKFKNVTGIVQNINDKKGNKILGNHEKILFGNNYFYEELDGIKYKVHYASFFQINLDITLKLYEFIKENLKESDVVADAFCGTGAIGIFISDFVKKVYLIENNYYAYDDLKHNIIINNKSNCVPILGDANNELLKLKDIDTIIFDPPRKGIDIKTLESITDNIKKIIYVSCNPTTQKRDINILQIQAFMIDKMRIFDMFPNTYHIENVIILKRGTH